ncbi:hypothetical protein ACH4C2_26095 [Streptomyces sp. NPDC018057]|uniref:hypothetical protein n=1 Tax=unclassified Streptomyces TaxID=2593676 RepID=UPI00378C7855
MTTPSHPTEPPPPPSNLTDEVLGVFTRGSFALSDGTLLYDSSYSLTRDLGGRTVTLQLATTDPAEAHRLLPRLRHAVAHHADLHHRAVTAVVHTLSDGPPTPDDLTEAHTDLLLDTIEATSPTDLTLHLSDSCGEHFLDGYWPAVRFDGEGGVVGVTVEA